MKPKILTKTTLIKSMTLLLLLLMGSWGLTPPTQAEGTVYEVECGGVIPNLDLFRKIILANGNPGQDTLKLAPGCTYTLTIPHNGNNGLPPITNHLIIEGNGATIERSTQPGTPEFRILFVRDDVNLTLNNLILRNGYLSSGSSEGGAVFAGREVNLNISKVTFLNNRAGAGGAVFVDSEGTVTITDESLFEKNEVFASGGGLFARSPVNISHSRFIENTGQGGGGGVYAGAGGTVTESIFEANAVSTSHGGGLYVRDDTTLINTEFINNTAAQNGGGVYQLGSSTLIVKGSQSQFLGNKAQSGNGGGLYANGAVIITDSAFTENLAKNSGGGVLANKDATMTNTTFLKNRAESNGGGAYVGRDDVNLGGTTTITGGWFEGNQAFGSGGGLYAQNTLALTGTDLISNTASSDDGAIFVGSQAMKLTINNARFLRNKGRGGGAVGAFNSTTIIEVSLFEENEARFTAGGALVAFGAVDISHTNFISNTAYTDGGGLFAHGGAITDSQFEGNKSVKGRGGGVFVVGDITLLGTAFTDNRAALSGGGVHLEGEYALTVAESYFAKNHAEHSGGGLYTQGTIDLSRSTLISNSARATGSGLFIAQQYGGASHVVNNLWVGNHNTTGAGYTLSLLFDVHSQGSVNVWHNTFAQSSLTQERGILAAKAGVTLADNIIANFDVGLLGGKGVVSNYNLFAGNAQNILGSASSDSDLNAELPHFADPANGDYHLRSDSPAIDAGLDVDVGVDLDGMERPQGEGFDIGAYEFSGAPAPDPDPNPDQGVTVYLPLVVK